MTNSLYKAKGSWTTEQYEGPHEVRRINPVYLVRLAFTDWPGRYAAYCVLRGLIKFGPGVELGMWWGEGEA